MISRIDRAPVVLALILLLPASSSHFTDHIQQEDHMQLKTKRTETQRFQHCGHLMMLVRLPRLQLQSHAQSQAGLCCTCCGKIVNLSSRPAITWN